MIDRVKPQISILSAYEFHMFQQARQMERLGLLKQLLTAMPVSRTQVSTNLVDTRIYFSGIRYLFSKIFPSSDRILSRMVIEDFDKWAGKSLRDPILITALSSFATNTLESAHSRGIATVCDRGSWHILEQKKVLDDEAVKRGVDCEYFDPWIVDREIKEYSVVDKIIVPSNRAGQSFINQGIPEDKISVIPYGVNIEMYVPNYQLRQPNRIVSVGTVCLRKGQKYLVDAFRSLKTNNASLTLVGPVLKQLEEILDVKKGDISVTGPLPRQEVVKELQASSIFALTSVEEGLALVIPQAMACGLPIIATEATGAGEIIESGIHGFIVPDRDVSALAEAIEYLLSNPEEAAHMGQEARKRVKELNGWNTYGEMLKEEYEILFGQ